mgnify:CR=1 FL=1
MVAWQIARLPHAFRHSQQATFAQHGKFTIYQEIHIIDALKGAGISAAIAVMV